MTADWQQVTTFFHAARALEGPARATFLDLSCGPNGDLRAQVEALLASDQNDSFLETPPNTAIVNAVGALACPLTPGQVLKERYVIEQRIAAGGQALVYRATDRLLSRPVIIKVMRGGGHDASMKARFQQEMRALSKIDHPAVVGIVDVGELEDGSPFLVIQYIDGPTLREVLKAGPVERLRAVAIIRAIGTALEAAHAAGVAHRDLKPENVMLQNVNGCEIVRLIDFGIAKIDQAGLAVDVTTVMIAGTVRYMAPEQFEGRNSPASDIYAFGLLTCELLSGQPHPRALIGTIHPKVRDVIDTALAYRPEDRPADVQQWSETVSGLLVPRPFGSLRSRAAAVGAVCIVILAAILVGQRLRSHPAERIVEKVGAFDPVSEGFRIHSQLAGTVELNGDNSGYEGWSVESASVGGGYYYHPLTDWQKSRAVARGWTLTAEMRVDRGVGYAIVDLAGHSKRFDINVYSGSDMDFVRLQTQIVPRYEGMDLAVPRGAYHRFELRFDASLQGADLWVDGQKRLTGYKGHGQFQEDRGLMFGTAAYKSHDGRAAFKSVRFEINP